MQTCDCIYFRNPCRQAGVSGFSFNITEAEYNTLYHTSQQKHRKSDTTNMLKGNY